MVVGAGMRINDWPDGWERMPASRVINFLGVNTADTYQRVVGPKERVFYCRRRGDTGWLEIQYKGTVIKVSPTGYVDDLDFRGAIFPLIKQVIRIINI